MLKKTVIFLLLPAITAGSLVAISPALAMGESATASSASSTRLPSGEKGSQVDGPDDFFRGVFFGRGSVARNLASVNGTSPPRVAREEIRAQESILKSLRADHPNELDSFAEAVTQGSPADIRAAIVQMSDLLAALYPANDDPRLGTADGKCLIAVLVIAVSVSIWNTIDVDNTITRGSQPQKDWARLARPGTLTLDGLSADLYEIYER